MLIKNSESADLSNLLNTALNNLDYPSNRINSYVFLVEEALTVWREELDPDSELSFTRTDRGNDAFFEFTVKERKLDPFAKDAIINYEKPIRTMYDRLLSGIGTELRYSYRKGVNRITLRLPKTDIRDTLFRRLAISSILPCCFQHLVTCVVSNVGIIILGFLSSEAMSGVSFASQIVLIHTLFIQVAVGAVNSILSQFWGKRKGSSAIYAMWIAVAASTAVCFIEFIVCFFFPQQLIGLYTNIPELIQEGAAFLRIASVSFLFNSFCSIFYAFLRVTNQGAVATRIVLYSCVLNIAVNLLLVFGLFGLPKLGTVGSGIAMTVGVLFQFILCLARYIKIKPSFYNSGDEINSSHIIKTFFKNALPIFMQTSVYLVGVNFIAAAIGRIDAEIIAAYSLVNNVFSYIFSVKDACGEATGILAGLQLGRKHFEEAKYENSLLRKLALKLSFASVLTMFVTVFLLQFLPIKLDDASKQYLLPLSVFFGINGMFGFQNVVSTNAMFAGGIARPVFFIDAANALFVSVPISLLSIKLNCFAPMLLLFLCKIDETVTFIPKLLAARQGKWLRNIVE